MDEYIKKEDVYQHLDNEVEWKVNQDRLYALEVINDFPAAEVAEVRHAEWKYYHKQNKAVCTNCSFERDLDTNFGRAVTCPNCGALMKEN